MKHVTRDENSHADLDIQNRELPPVKGDEEEATPYADAMLKAFDELLESSDEDRSLLTRLANQLWKKESLMPLGEAKPVKSSLQRPANARVRLDKLIRRALQVRQNTKRSCMKHGASMTRT